MLYELCLSGTTPIIAHPERYKAIQDDISISKHNVLRGIHGDNKTWKLISCLYGIFYLLVVNNDKIIMHYFTCHTISLGGAVYLGCCSKT